ncbi:hypothetical protein [Bdellovibrio bacteriovorus]|uniref:hypothetical protein n=1 Tax=Bdellovibrio TaxID=958 RepID=UPI0035A835C2
MNLNTFLSIYYFLAVLLFAGKALALCSNLSISSIQTLVDLNSSAQQTLVIEVSTGVIQLGSCSFALTFSYGNGGLSAPHRALQQSSYRWNYTLAKDLAETQILPSSADATSATALIGSIPAGQSKGTVTYHILLDQTNPWQRFGSYSDVYSVRLYNDVLDLLTLPSDTKSVTAQYTAPKKADLSLVNSGGVFDLSDTAQTINFGVLNSGASSSFDLILKYNAGSRLLASSDNGGNMKHATAADLIPYSMTLNGVAINLNGSSTSPALLINTTGVSPASGSIHPVSITLGNAGGVSAGSYNDKITFTIESTE